MLRNLPKEVSSFLTVSTSLNKIKTYSLEIKSRHDADALREAVIDIFVNKIKPYYNENNLVVNNAVFNFLLEPLKNANFHGGNNQEHSNLLELLLSPVCLVGSYFDGGDYFSREEVKQY